MATEKTVIVYTCDNNYAMQAGVSLTSLFENNKKQKFLLYLISDNIRDENKDRISEICRNYNQEICIIEMPDLDELCGKTLSVNWWAKSAYCRLFLTMLLPKEIDRLLYFDPDTIIVNSIDYLIEVLNSSEFDSYFAAGCIDINAIVKRYHGFKRSELYFNTGVFLINLKKWRDEGIQEIFLSEIDRRKGKAVEVEQCYIDCVLINKIMKLPAQYNVMPSFYWSYDQYSRGFSDGEVYTKEEIEYAVQNPVVIHFCGCANVIRPWFSNSNHPMKEKWKEYYMMTAWKNETLQEYKEKNPKKCGKIKGFVLWNAVKVPILARLCVRKVYGFSPKLFRNL